GEEGRLAGVRVPKEPGVGEELELQAEGPLLARGAGLGDARGLVEGALEVDVPLAALAAFADDDALAVGVDVVEDLAGLDVLDHRADRDADDLVVAALAVLVLVPAVF